MSFPSGSLYKIAIDTVKLKSKTFAVLIEIGNEDPLFVFDYTATLLEWGEFTIGNESDNNETVFLPGSFTIRIKLAISDYIVIKRVLKGNYHFVRITVTEETNTFFAGQLSRIEDVAFDDYLCSIKLLFIDEFRMLKRENDVIASHSPNLIYISLKDMIKTIFLDPQDLSTYALTVRILQNFKYEYYPNLVDYLDSFGTWDGYVFSNEHYPTRASVLKMLLHNLGCVAVIGFHREILLLPRSYNKGRIVRIHRRNHSKDEIEQSLCKKYRGMVVSVLTHGPTYQKIDFGTVEREGEHYKYPEEIYELDFMLSGSSVYEPSPQNPGYTEFSFRLGDAWLYTPIKYNSFQMKLPGQNNWSVKDSLFNHIIPKLWYELSIARSKYRVTLFGTDYDYFTYFRFGNERSIFRPIKFVYDFVRDTTEVTMVEDPSWLYPEDLTDTIMMERFIAD